MWNYVSSIFKKGDKPKDGGLPEPEYEYGIEVTDADGKTVTRWLTKEEHPGFKGPGWDPANKPELNPEL